MSEQSLQERTEQATPKRLEEARKRGQVPRSVDLSAAAVLLAAGGALYLGASGLVGQLAALMRGGLAFDLVRFGDERDALTAFGDAVAQALLALAPVLGVTFVAALAAPILIGGWNLSGEALAFRGDRINPLAGLGRMFSARSLVELAKAIMKFALVGAVAVLVLYVQADPIQHLSRQPIMRGMRESLELCGQALILLSACIAAIATLDVPYQLWQHARDLRMTKQELREESKETDGAPEVKGRIRSAQQALARRRMMAEVPKADVVITNPTHFAVALRYDEARMRAPVVVAKGADEVAARIRAVAEQARVPLVEAPPLARALFRVVDLGAEIPTALYVAVAQILTYVFQLRTARDRGDPAPVLPQIDPEIESQVERRGRRGDA
jgi:flagellar biosynthesis protein FlhB